MNEGRREPQATINFSVKLKSELYSEGDRVGLPELNDPINILRKNQCRPQTSSSIQKKMLKPINAASNKARKTPVRHKVVLTPI